MTTIKLSPEATLTIEDNGSIAIGVSFDREVTGSPLNLTSNETEALYEALHAALLARYSKLATEVEEKS